ncbi:MAG: family 43 glycosylhydrolase [Acholeplasmataceae bacterium]|nr:family 43 glycosylhydrolase [Acholeplasmataceae bacterium]
MKLHKIQLRDPYIYADKKDNRYYLYGSIKDRHRQFCFYVYTSTNLEDWDEGRIIFSRSDSFWGVTHFWAPELHYIDGEYYLFATFMGANGYNRSQILKSNTPDGTFVPYGEPLTPLNTAALDATYFEFGGKRYSVYCHEWKDVGDGQMCLLELDDDLRPLSHSEILFRASDAPWVVNASDKEICLVTDGPFIVKHNETLFMLWSSLPEGVWTDFFTGDIYDVPKNGKKLTLMRKKESIPVLVKAGGIIPLSGDKGNSVANPQKMDVLVYNGEGEYDLYEDLLTEEKEGQAITHFKTYTIEDNNIFKQILTIRTAGDDGVIPENRELTVRFKNISEGEITVYKDGKLMTIEEVLTDCAAVRVNHERNAEIRIEVLYKKLSALDYLQERARKVLLGVEGDNIKKSMTYEMIKKATSIAEYVLVVDNSEVSLAAKKKLKEVL